MKNSTSNKLLKKLHVYQGEHPLPQELELMAESEKRVSLMLKARWLFLLLLGVYEFSIIISLEGELLANIVGPFFVPVAAFMLMITYNLWYQRNYQQFSHLRGVNYTQTIFDIIFALIVIHYTGGVLSWAWLVYPLIVVEAALLLDKKAATWSIVFISSLLYGLLLIIEAHMPRLAVQVPFLSLLLQNTFTHDFLFWLRFNIITVFFAIVSIYLMGVIRKDEAKLKEHIVTDSLTGLYNTAHFLRSLNSEVSRAKRYKQPLSLLLINLNNFKDFNLKFGYQEGNQLLCSVAAILKQNLRRSNSDTDSPYDVDIACRYEGDKFAVILPNTPSEAAAVPAQRIKETIQNNWQEFLPEGLCQEIADAAPQVTIRVGIVGYPEHGESYQEVLKTAEKILAEAKCNQASCQ